MTVPRRIGRPGEFAEEPGRLAWFRRLVVGVTAGCALLLAGAAAVRLTGTIAEPDRLVFTPLAVAVAFAESVGYVFLPGLVVSVGIERIARDGESPRTLLPMRERMLELFTGSRIVGLLLLGGATVFLTVAYLIEGRWFVPPLAVLTLVGAAIQYPAAGAAAGWMAEQHRRIERLRDV